jgi:amino acid transporter/GNAT superfamily N-acetyltransferase
VTDQLTGRTSKVSRVLAAHRLGVAGVVFFVVAAAAPLTTAAGGATTGFAVTGVLGLPLAYLAVAVVLAIFAAGYVAMSRHITNAGALYSYVVHGLGRIPGVAASFVALLAYNAMQIGLYGIFGMALRDLLRSFFHVSVHWWICALAGWAVIAVVGVLRVDVNGRVLALLLAAECVVVVVYDLVFVGHPAGDGISFDTLNPANLATSGWGASLAVAVAGFVGFEGSAVFAEETKDPRRTVARATFIALAFICLLYTVSSWALSVITGPAAIVASSAQQGPMLVFNLGDVFLGRAFTDLGQILFVTSLFAALLSFHHTVARYLFSLGREEVLPRGLGSTHYRTGSPYGGSITQSVLALLVVVASALAGIDPVASLFFVGTSLGALGVLILMVATSLAVIGYFRERPGLERPWSRAVAPFLGGVLLTVVLVLVLVNFHTLLSLPPEDPRCWAVPAVFGVAAAIGLLWGWFLKVDRPEVYRTIGLGPNRVTGRAVSEFDSELGEEVSGRVSTGHLASGGLTWTLGQVAAPARPEIEVVRLQSTAELDLVADVLAEAYQADLPGEWLIPDPDDRAVIYPTYFKVLARHALRGAGEVYATAERNAVAIWYPAPYGIPNVAPADYDTQLEAATGPYLSRFAALDATLQAGHPMAKAHQYLQFMGVRPEFQSRGIGSALLAHRLTELHRKGMPAYLEATNRRNLALYLHHGFTVIGTVRVAEEGPVMYRLWREARSH